MPYNIPNDRLDLRADFRGKHFVAIDELQDWLDDAYTCQFAIANERAQLLQRFQRLFRNATPHADLAVHLEDGLVLVNWNQGDWPSKRGTLISCLNVRETGKGIANYSDRTSQQTESALSSDVVQSWTKTLQKVAYEMEVGHHVYTPAAFDRRYLWGGALPETYRRVASACARLNWQVTNTWINPTANNDTRTGQGAARRTIASLPNIDAAIQHAQVVLWHGDITNLTLPLIVYNSATDTFYTTAQT